MRLAVLVQEGPLRRVARRSVVRVSPRRVFTCYLGRVGVQLWGREGVPRREEGCALLERVAQGEEEGQDQLAQLCRMFVSSLAIDAVRDSARQNYL